MSFPLLRQRWTKPGIEASCWEQMYLVNKSSMLIKCFFDEMDAAYTVMIYDGLALWQEDVSVPDFRIKAKSFNPNVEANATYLLKQLQSVFLACVKKTDNLFSQTVVAGQEVLVFALKAKLDIGVPFSWSFHFKKCDANKLNEVLIQPCFIAICELHRRQAELFQILEKKDQQIEDYKDQGAVSSRGHFVTLPFDRASFENSANIDKEFVSSCQSTFPYSFASSATQALLKNVVINRKCALQVLETVTTQALADSVASPATALDSDAFAPTLVVSKQSWSAAERIPPSVSNEDRGTQYGTEEPARCLARDVDSVEPLSGLVGTQDMEQARRNALRRRLEDEAERKMKKKKRKVNI